MSKSLAITETGPLQIPGNSLIGVTSLRSWAQAATRSGLRLVAASRRRCIRSRFVLMSNLRQPTATALQSHPTARKPCSHAAR